MNAEHGMHSSRKSGYDHSGHGKKPDASTMIFEVLDAKGKSK